jgi:hypothetical protein
MNSSSDKSFHVLNIEKDGKEVKNRFVILPELILVVNEVREFLSNQSRRLFERRSRDASMLCEFVQDAPDVPGAVLSGVAHDRRVDLSVSSQAVPRQNACRVLANGAIEPGNKLVIEWMTEPTPCGALGFVDATLLDVFCKRDVDAITHRPHSTPTISDQQKAPLPASFRVAVSHRDGSCRIWGLMLVTQVE